MSSIALAGSPRPIREVPERHLEIAPTRVQRRARPRIIFAIATIIGIGVILLVQLGMTIALADGAYQISDLQVQQRDLVRQEASLTENLQIRSSTQNLTENAEQLGMIASGNPLFLNLSTGSVSGHPTPAGGSLGGRGNLIKNSLLDGSTLIDPAAIAAARAAGEVGGSGAPTTTEAAPSVSSIPGLLPSPTTH